MWLTRILEKNYHRGITWKLKKVEQSFLYASHRPDLIRIPIKLHEDISELLLNYGAYKNAWKN